MPRKRKYRKRSSNKIKKNSVYRLVAFIFFASGFVSLLSFAKSGESFTEINNLLTQNFGFFSFLVPVNLLIFSLVIFGMKNKLTKIHVWLGLVVSTVGLLGLFKSGGVGTQIFLSASSLFGTFLTSIILFIGVVLGITVTLDISFAELFKLLAQLLAASIAIFNKSILPLFRIKRDPNRLSNEPKIQGYKDNKQEKLPEPEINRPSNQPKPTQEQGESVDALISNKPLELGVWEYPPLSLLSTYKDKKKDTDLVKQTASTIEKTLESFGVKTRVVEINVGPSVTQYAIEIALGTKLSKITGLANDLALATQAPTGQIRIEAPIPGRNLVGIEIPNSEFDMVGLKAMLESKQMREAKSKLAIPLGLNISGVPIVADISKMPHVLIAGTTGSGKSVIMNSIITSILFRASPNEVKMIMIDPKRVEFTGFNDIPHLLVPVVNEVQKAVSALKWALKAMDERYIEFSKHGVRNIEGYNEMAGFQRLPYIVVLIDELADLMALAPVEVEDSIARLAQMARATGIHLVLATQRPSVDVITGLIKANIPSRISFNVSSMIDSKVIIDMPGAEKLLGRGDMLFVPPDQAKPTRIQGTFVSDQDVKRVVNFIKSRGVPVEYTDEVLEQQVLMKRGGGGVSSGGADGQRDNLFDDAIRLMAQHDKISVSMMQRKLGIGFNRASNLMEQLEQVGAVGPSDGSKPRDVKVRNADEFIASLNQQ